MRKLSKFFKRSPKLHSDDWVSKIPLGSEAIGNGNVEETEEKSCLPLSVQQEEKNLSTKPEPLSRQNSGIATAVQERLAKEVIRKLRLAIDAEGKEDRDIVCSEVFADITGGLNAAARESTGDIYKRWYEVLAPYFCKTHEASEVVLMLCRQLWGQPFTAPIYSLLLHQWLLVHPEAGGLDQRLKHLNILVSGARQVFLGDIETSREAFRPLYVFIAEQVVLARPCTRLEAIPAAARESLVSLTAAFYPYYYPATHLALAIESFPGPGDSFVGPGGGADFAIDRIVDLLGKEVRAEAAVLQYLDALGEIKRNSQVPNFISSALRTATRVRLQGELYALTQAGGPRYASRRINKVAFRTLDLLFPHGRRTRRLVNLAFRFLHPQEWPWVWYDTCRAVVHAAFAWVQGVINGIRGFF